MKGLIKTLFVVASAVAMGFMPIASNASEIIDSQASEAIGISLKGLKVYHQFEWRNLSINLEYVVAEDNNDVDVLVLKKRIRTFMEEYSNPTDFWEVMNVKLVGSLAEAFPELLSIESRFSLLPDQTLFSPRSSIVKYEKGLEALKESFQFTKLKYLICQSTFRALDLTMKWDIRENPEPTDYPDYLWIQEAMETFFKAHPVSLNQWKELKPQLEAYLLEKFSTLTAMDVEVTAAE